MKKNVLLSLLIIITLNSSICHAAFFKQCEYIEKYQWGALEDILSDLKTNKITTDECALYGCYILIAQEPSRIDREEKIKLIPARYILNKKSNSADPYFFIDFLYSVEEILSKKALHEFRKSDWSDYEYFSQFASNDNVLKNIETVPFKSSRTAQQYRNIVTPIEDAINNKYIDAEVGYLIIYQNAYFNEWFENRHKELLSKYKLSTTEANEWLPFLCNSGMKIRKSKNTKIIKLLNYFDDARNKNKFLQNFR